MYQLDDELLRLSLKFNIPYRIFATSGGEHELQTMIDLIRCVPANYAPPSNKNDGRKNSINTTMIRNEEHFDCKFKDLRAAAERFGFDVMSGTFELLVFYFLPFNNLFTS